MTLWHRLFMTLGPFFWQDRVSTWDITKHLINNKRNAVSLEIHYDLRQVLTLDTEWTQVERKFGLSMASINWRKTWRDSRATLLKICIDNYRIVAVLCDSYSNGSLAAQAWLWAFWSIIRESHTHTQQDNANNNPLWWTTWYYQLTADLMRLIAHHYW